VIERRGVIASFRRSWRLVEGSFWRTVAVILPVELLVALVLAAPTTLAVVLARTVGPFVGQQLTATLLTVASLVVALSLKSCAYTVLYFDLRMRAEGLDLAWRSRAAKETDA
jgi:hypothetical protein